MVQMHPQVHCKEKKGMEGEPVDGMGTQTHSKLTTLSTKLKLYHLRMRAEVIKPQRKLRKGFLQSQEEYIDLKEGWGLGWGT